MFWFSSALAQSVCVPEVFGHWACELEAATLADALLLGDVVHLRWDVFEANSTEVAHSTTVYGHPGPGGLRPTLGGLSFTDGDSRISKLELLDQGGVAAAALLRIEGDAQVRLRHVGMAHQADTSQIRAVFLTGSAHLDAIGLSITRWDADLNGPVLRLVDRTTARLEGCAISGGRGEEGAVLARDEASVTLVDSHLWDNRGSLLAGAAQVRGHASATVVGGTYVGNMSLDTALDAGGGTFRVRDHGTLTVTDAVFCGNSSSQNGGALWGGGDSTVTVSDTLFSNNSSVSNGAAVYGAENTAIDLSHLSVSHNDALADGFVHTTDPADVYTRDSVLVDAYTTPVISGGYVDTSLFWGSDPAAYTSAISSTHLITDVDPGTTPDCSPQNQRPACDLLPPLAGASDGSSLGMRVGCISPDTDGDGLMDHHEAGLGTDPLHADSDGDGLADGEECAGGAAWLINPSFESPAHGPTAVHPNSTVPGWSAEDGFVTLATASDLGAFQPAGSQVLVVDGEISQVLRVEPRTEMVVTFQHTNPSSTSESLTMTLEDPDGQVLLSHADTLAAAQVQTSVPFTVPDDLRYLRLRFSSNLSYVDQVYAGPSNDSDGDGEPDCKDHDSDADGLADGDELLAGSDSANPDTDGDGMPDGSDPQPTVADTDQDGLPDVIEHALGSDVNHPDSNGDGVGDALQCASWFGDGFESGETVGVEGVEILTSGGEVPPAHSGAHVGALTSAHLDVSVAGSTRYSFWHRARFGTVDTVVHGAGVPASFESVDTEWRYTSGTVTTAPLLLTIAANAELLIDDLLVVSTDDLDVHGVPLCVVLPDSDHDGFTADIDCDDHDPFVNPGTLEVCDGLDNDCDGHLDEDAIDATSWFLDADDDGWGGTVPIYACEAPDHHVFLQGDCDDDDPLSHPTAVELCDGLDNDCDGHVEPQTVGFADHDSDGFGAGPLLSSCDGGLVPLDGDCRDDDPAINPSAEERCDGVDNDCDDTIDLGAVDTRWWHADDDGDGFGRPEQRTAACDAPEGFVVDATDCDDTDPQRHPGREELCNGVDDNCLDGDEPDAGFSDRDGDGFGDPGSPLCGGIPDATDCDDDDASVHPGAEELLGDEVDQDCDGRAQSALTYKPAGCAHTARAEWLQRR